MAGNWKQLKGKIREGWGKLTDRELDVLAGKRDQLIGKIQGKYGAALERAKKELDKVRKKR
jgi:uncharacterized protein YjbJ (UPF0337 family)